MARTIGKVKIRKLKKLVYDTRNKYLNKYGYDFITFNQYQIKEEVKSLIPEDWFYTWEMAWSEINNIVDDEWSNIRYGAKS